MAPGTPSAPPADPQPTPDLAELTAAIKAMQADIKAMRDVQMWGFNRVKNIDENVAAILASVKSLADSVKQYMPQLIAALSGGAGSILGGIFGGKK